MENEIRNESVATPLGNGIRVTLAPEWDDWTTAAQAYISAGQPHARDGSPAQLYAIFTTDHSASSYGVPVIVLADGQALGPADTPWPGFSVRVIVPNPGPGWEVPAVEALIDGAQAAGYQIEREEW